MLQVKKLSDQQTESEEQNATFESFQNIERCQEEGQCFLKEIQQFPNLELDLNIARIANAVPVTLYSKVTM